MNKLQTEAMDRNTECAPMEPEFRVLPDLGGNSVRGNTDVLGESPLLTEEALNTMPSRLSFIKWAKSRGLDVSEIPSHWNDRRFESDNIEIAWIAWFNALNSINPVDHNIVAAVRGEAVAECPLPAAGWYCMRAAGHSGPCAAVAKPIDHEKEILEVIGQRDKYHDMADQLAAQIAAMTEVDIGEHSSANEPWRNALIASDEFIAAKFRAFCNAPVSARAADALDSQPTDDGARATQAASVGEVGTMPGTSGFTMSVFKAAEVPVGTKLYLASVPVAPDGWKLVPIRPTSRMTEAGVDARLNGATHMDSLLQWRAMLAAAPAPDSSQPTDGGVRNDLLMRFYAVDSMQALIEAQEQHISKLQAKLPSDTQPAFTGVREG